MATVQTALFVYLNFCVLFILCSIVIDVEDCKYLTLTLDDMKDIYLCFVGLHNTASTVQ
jgi:hypothetical protein